MASFASQAKAKGLSITRNSKEGNSEHPRRGDIKQNAKASNAKPAMSAKRSDGEANGARRSFASQAKAKILPRFSIKRNKKAANAEPVTNARLSDSTADTISSFASQAKANRLSIKQDTNASSKPATNAKRSDGGSGAAPSFASQAKAKGLSIKQNTNDKKSVRTNGLSIKQVDAFVNAKASSSSKQATIANRSGSEAGSTPSFASQAKAKGLSIKQNTESRSAEPMMRSNGATSWEGDDWTSPSFASQVKANGLSIKQNTKNTSTKQYVNAEQ